MINHKSIVGIIEKSLKHLDHFFFQICFIKNSVCDFREKQVIRLGLGEANTL